VLKQFEFGDRSDDFRRVREAAHSMGCFYARHPRLSEARLLEAISAARAFFALPVDERLRLAIEHSPHYRGYSEMRNERDWREQIHFGREEAAIVHQQLRGPNLWPADARWRTQILALIDDLEAAARDILTALSPELPYEDDSPYLLLKLIHYPAWPGLTPRHGVAPHVDFSWIALVIQDDTGGLEMRTPAGEWIEIPARPGAVVVNTGEVLQFATRGYLQATPHRVVNRSREQSRVSMPFFFNPPLTQVVSPLAGPVHPLAADREHVHRVLRGTENEPFLFGDAEWRRKGLGVWCKDCVHPSTSKCGVKT